MWSCRLSYTAGLLTGAAPSANAAEHKHPLWKKLLLAASTVFLLLLVLEGALRIAGAKPKTATVLSHFFQHHASYGWHGIAGASFQFATVDFDVRISHDDDGLRRCGLQSRIDEDAAFPGTMVWVLGDSTTWGWGIADEETYVDRLNQLGPDDLEFRNLGMTGFATPQEHLLLTDYFERGRRPDLVLILYSGNDLNENLSKGGIRPCFEVVDGKVELRNHPVPRSAKWNVSARLKKSSLVYNYLHFYLTTLKLKLRTRAREAKYEQARERSRLGRVPPTEEQLVALREGYGMIQRLCQDHGVRFAVIAKIRNEARDVALVCPELGVPVLDLSDAWTRHLEDEHAPSLRFRSDPHANATGHRLIAESLYPKVSALLAEHGPPARSG